MFCCLGSTVFTPRKIDLVMKDFKLKILPIPEIPDNDCYTSMAGYKFLNSLMDKLLNYQSRSCKTCKHMKLWGHGEGGYCINPDVKEMMYADEGPYSVTFEPPLSFHCSRHVVKS